MNSLMIKLGAIVAVSLLITTAFGYVENLRTRNKELSATVEGLKSVNLSLAESLNNVTESRAIDSEVITSLNSAIEDIYRKGRSMSAGAAALRKEDSNADNYLSTTVPDSVRRLYQPDSGLRDKDTSTDSP